MLKLHGRCGCHTEAYDLVSGWEKQHGMKPSVIHFTCLMSGCLRTKSYDQAWSAFELMIANGVQPDATALSTLLPGMVAAQHWERVVQLARAATSSGKSAVPSETLNNALSQMQVAGGQGRLLEQLRECMQVAGVVVTARHASAALRARNAAAAAGGGQSR